MDEADKSDDAVAGRVGRLLEQLGGTHTNGQGLQQLVPRLQQRVQGTKMLLLLDNLWDAKQLTSVLPQKAQLTPGSCVIITSRYNAVEFQTATMPEVERQRQSDAEVGGSKRHAETGKLA